MQRSGLKSVAPLAILKKLVKISVSHFLYLVVTPHPKGQKAAALLSSLCPLISTYHY